MIPNKRILGNVPDFEGEPRAVVRSYDGLDLTGVTQELLPSGVRELEKRIADYWRDLACWRAGRLDFGAYRIDVGECREILAGFPGLGDPDDLTDIDWHEVGLRLDGLRRYGGYGELSRLHRLLTCDDPEAFNG